MNVSLSLKLYTVIIVIERESSEVTYLNFWHITNSYYDIFFRHLHLEF